jgi:hypothetical protein
VPLSPEQLSLLAQVKAAKKLVPDDSSRAPLAELFAGGLLQEETVGRGKLKQRAYALSPAGKLALTPAKAPAKPRAAKAAPLTAADLAASEARILARIDLLARKLGVDLSLQPTEHADAPIAAPAPTHPAPAAVSAAVSAGILAAIREADLAGRHGGLVPIPEVRKLAAARTGVSRDRFDSALLALERDLRVDLKIANDPNRPDAEEGIRVNGRGLVYFALSK